MQPLVRDIGTLLLCQEGSSSVKHCEHRIHAIGGNPTSHEQTLLISWNLSQEVNQPRHEVGCQSAFVPIAHGTTRITVAHQVRGNAADMCLLLICSTPIQVVICNVIPFFLQVCTRQVWNGQLKYAGNPRTPKSKMHNVPYIALEESSWVTVVVHQVLNHRRLPNPRQLHSNCAQPLGPRSRYFLCWTQSGSCQTEWTAAFGGTTLLTPLGCCIVCSVEVAYLGKVGCVTFDT